MFGETRIHFLGNQNIKNIKKIKIIFSSLEHEVLRISCCDSNVFVVVCASFIACHQLFGLCTHQRPHFQSDYHETSSECVCLDEISNEFENGSCQVKNKVTRSNLRKVLCTL